MLVVACNCPKGIPHSKKDTTTGHWEYTHDEEMKWVPNSTKSHK